MAAHKALWAPNRSLTQDELDDAKTRFNAEWQQIVEKQDCEYESWAAIRQAKLVEKRLKIHGPIAPIAQAAEADAATWAVKDKFVADVMVEHSNLDGNGNKKTMRRGRAYHDPCLWQRSDHHDDAVIPPWPEDGSNPVTGWKKHCPRPDSQSIHKCCCGFGSSSVAT